MLTPDDLAPVVLALLRKNLGDSTAQLDDLKTSEMPVDGYSGNTVHRVALTWTRGGHDGGAARWVLKRWRPDGHTQKLYGVGHSVEALAWDHGVLRPEAMPPGIAVPLLGVCGDANGSVIWLAMDDVSASLDRYSRAVPLPGDVAVARLRTALSRLAGLHVWWEAPERQERLRRCDWLVPSEQMLWCEAGSYAEALGRPRPAQAAAGSIVTDEFRANVAAFLQWLPARDRPLIAEILCDRSALGRAIATLPGTLLHGDLDDRNLGLRAAPERPPSPPDHAGDDELVLIDWEWMGYGPPALDVSRVWASFAAVCDRSQALPSAVFSDELPSHYLEQYRRLGGRAISDDQWRRQFDLALLANGMSQVAFFGAMVRQNVTLVLNTLAPQIEMAMKAARALTSLR
jgi:hypothetical protein